MSISRFFVDGLARIEADQRTGIVRLTFHVNDGEAVEETVQIVLSVDNLNKVFQNVDETMRSTFGNLGGGRGSGPRHGLASFKDLTED